MPGNMLLLSANPKAKKSRKKPRTAAQRAATARLVALNRGGKTTRRKRRSSVARVARRARRSVGGMARGFNKSAVLGMLKSGAIGGAGAVGVDMIMGYAANVLPASVSSRLNADGSTNFMYYGAKAALAVGVGVLGQRVVSPSIAAKLGEGALSVMAYELIKGAMPAGTTGLSYINPAPMANRNGMRRIVSTGGNGVPGVTGMNKIVSMSRPNAGVFAFGNRR